MSTQFAITCPHCAATLKLKDNKFVGKKVPCPKCKQPFVVEQPPEDEFVAGEADEYGAADAEESEQEEGFESPRATGKSKGDAKGGKGKKKKAKSGGGIAPMAMIGGGVVLGLGLLGGIVYAAIAMFGGSAAPNSWVKWLPAETELALQVRVADSLSAPIFKPITDNPTLSKLMNQPPLPQNGGGDSAIAFWQGLGVQAKDVDTVTVGVVDGVAMTEASNNGHQKGPQQFVAVIRLKSPLDASKLDQAAKTVFSKEDYNGKALYSVVQSTSPKVAVHSVDPTTYLMGSLPELKAAIDGNGAAPAAKRFSFADATTNLVFVMAPSDPSKLKSLGISTLKKTGLGQTQTLDEAKGIYGIAYSIQLGQDLRVHQRVSLDSSMAEGTAKQMKTELDSARALFQTEMGNVSGGNPFVPQDSIKKLMGHVDAMLGGAEATASGSEVNVTMTLSGQIVADTVQMAAPFMPMLEQVVKQQAEKAADPDAIEDKPVIGNKASDIFAYPEVVIKAGDKAKAKIHRIADKHNAELEAAMQEGKPAAEVPAEGEDAEKAAPAAPEKPVAESADEEEEVVEEAAIPENDDDIPEGLAGMAMRQERQKAREAAAAKKAGKSAPGKSGAKKTAEDESIESAEEDAEMKSQPDANADPDAVPGSDSDRSKKSKKKKGNDDDDEEAEASGDAPDDSGVLSKPALGEDPDAAPSDSESPPQLKMKKKESADEEEEVVEEAAIPENDDDIPDGLAGMSMRLERQKAREAAAAKKAGKAAPGKSRAKKPAEDESKEDVEMKSEPDPNADPDAIPASDSDQPKKKKMKNDEEAEATDDEPADSAEMSKAESESDPDAVPVKPDSKLSKKEQKMQEESGEQGRTGGNSAPATSKKMKDEPAAGDESETGPLMNSKKGDADEEAADKTGDDEKPKPAQKSRSRRRTSKDKSAD